MTRQIIRTEEDLDVLIATDRDTVLLTRLGDVWGADAAVPHDLPAVVLATGAQVRAARRALEGQHGHHERNKK